MGALGFGIEIDTTGSDGPRLVVDGNEVPLVGFSYEQDPTMARWSFVVPVDGDTGPGLVAALDMVDPEALEAEAMARFDAYDGQSAPLTRALLSVLREELRRARA